MTTTWNPSDKGTHITLSGGNLTATSDQTATNDESAVRATSGLSAGKYYFEFTLTESVLGAIAASSSASIISNTSFSVNSGGIDTSPNAWSINGNGDKKNGSGGVSYGLPFTNNDVVGCAVDFDNHKIWWSRNGTWIASGDPVAGTNAAFTNLSGTLYPTWGMFVHSSSNVQVVANFGASSFSYSVPSGFTAWNNGSTNAGSFAVTETADTISVAGTVAINAGSIVATEAQDTSTISGAVQVPECTWNPSDKGTHVTLSSGNLQAAEGSTSSIGSVRSTKSKSSGKWYWETKVTASPPDQTMGLTSGVSNLEGNLFSDSNSWGFQNGGTKINAGTSTAYGTGYTTNDTVGIAFDFDAGKLWFSTNGVWQGSGDPASGTNPAFTGVNSVPMFACWFGQNTSGSGPATLTNFGGSIQSYTVPTGFSPWGGRTPVAGTITATDGQDASTINISASADGTIAVTEGQDIVLVSGEAANTTASVVVAVGNTGTIIYSADAITWTQCTSGTTLNLNGVVQGGSGGSWVAVGNSGVIVRSAELSAAFSIVNSTTVQGLTGVAYGNGLFVAVGGAGTVVYSGDGFSWAAAMSGTTASLSAIHFANGQFVAVGGTVIRYSTDGIHWNSGGTTSPSVTLYDVNYSPSEGVWALSGLGRIFTSTSGQGSWTSRHTVTGTKPVSGLAWDVTDSIWMAVGGNRLVLTSSDGTTWSENTSLNSTTSSFNKVTHDGSQFILVGNRQGTSPNIYTTPDESVFTHQTVPASVIYNGVAVGDTSVPVPADVFGQIIATDAPDTLAGTGHVDTSFAVAGDLAATDPQDVFSGVTVSTTISGGIFALEDQDTASFSQGTNQMTIRMLQSSFDNIVTYGAFLFNGGLLNVYTGAQPTDPTAAPTGLMVASIQLPNPAFLDADDGTCVKTGDWSGSATNTGVAGWFRLTGPGGDIVDGTVTTSLGQGDMLASTTNFTVGDPVEVTSCHFQFNQLNS